MLNLAGFGPAEHQLLMQAGIEGLRDILALTSTTSGTRIDRAARRAQRRAADRPHDRGLVGAGPDARGRLRRDRRRRHRARDYHAAVSSTAGQRLAAS